MTTPRLTPAQQKVLENIEGLTRRFVTRSNYSVYEYRLPGLVKVRESTVNALLDLGLIQVDHGRSTATVTRFEWKETA